MTLGENKKVTLGLIEEYSPNNIYLTDDEDIATRLNLVYSTNYQKLSEIKKILKTKVLRDISGETSEGYEELSLPSNMYQFKKIIALDEDNNEVEADFRVIGKKIYISNQVDAKYILEYYAYPTVIKEDTSDDFTLEIDQDVQMDLCYMVASDILKVDPSSDYTAFEQVLKDRLSWLDTRTSISSANVIEGVL